MNNRQKTAGGTPVMAHLHHVERIVGGPAALDEPVALLIQAVADRWLCLVIGKRWPIVVVPIALVGRFTIIPVVVTQKSR